MNYLLNYSIFENKKPYNIGDVVYIEYWYKHIVTPVKINEIQGNKFLVSHNTEKSKIQNAPDELIRKNQIISKLRN